MNSRFVNRDTELAELSSWWERRGAQMGVVWGRRRVGKSQLIAYWARNRRAVLHTARTRPLPQELRAFSESAAPVLNLRRRDLRTRPFVDWDDVFEVLATVAETEPLLVVIDEFPELLNVDPEFPSALRAIWERVSDSNLRLLLCGSAVRMMERLLEERAPLYGRTTLRLHVQPFAPHEAALMLPDMGPAERAKAWGVCGGIPYYLALWEQSRTFRENLRTLVCAPRALLLTEGELILATEEFPGGRREHSAEQVLRAVSSGRTRFSEIESETGFHPARPLQALQNLRLIERVQPVGDRPDVRKAYYRIADNFLAFWLGVVERHQPAIQQGLGEAVVDVMEQAFNDHMGERWEEAFRAHLRRVLATDERVYPLVELGQFWKRRVGPREDPCELDAVGLSGRSRRLSVVGEAKWAKAVNGGRVLYDLERKLELCGLDSRAEVLFAIGARERVDAGTGLAASRGPILPVTAADIFA